MSFLKEFKEKILKNFSEKDMQVLNKIGEVLHKAGMCYSGSKSSLSVQPAQGMNKAKSQKTSIGR